MTRIKIMNGCIIDADTGIEYESITDMTIETKVICIELHNIALLAKVMTYCKNHHISFYCYDEDINEMIPMLFYER